MRQTVSRIMASIAIAITLFSCQQQQKDTIEITSGLTGGALVFHETGERQKSITVSFSNNWTLTLSDTWVSASPSSGEKGTAEITFTLSDPDFENPTTATALFSCGQTTHELPVILKKADDPTGIKISSAQRKIVVGQVMELSAVAEPETALIEGIRWSTSDTQVATIDEEGKVTGIAVGTFTVTATCGELSEQYDMEVTEVFTTDGLGTEYTMNDLAAYEYSGIVSEGEGFTVTEEICISDKDILVIEQPAQITIASGKDIRIEGSMEVTAQNVTFMNDNSSEEDAGIRFSGESDGGGKVRNSAFRGVIIKYYGAAPLEIDNCSFTEISAENSAIGMGGTAEVTISGCTFTANQGSAVSSAANLPVSVKMTKCTLENNSQGVSNKPQINLSVGKGVGVTISEVSVTGPAENTPNGGIAIANFTDIESQHDVLIEKCTVKDCRYGITLYGNQNARLLNNTIENNKWDSNPMSGGSGVSLYYYIGGELNVYMEGNTISGNLWGITNIGDLKSGVGPNLNLGCTEEGENSNPGENIFKDNGNGGVLYDLYNNSPIDVWAQGNIWNTSAQDEESIEEVIVHKKDNESYGLVTFMPAGTPAE